MEWNTLASQEQIDKTISALTANGIHVAMVDTKEAAHEAVVALIPSGAEVMTMTSVTLEETGISQTLNDTAKYNPSRDRLYSLDKATQGKEMNVLGSTSEWTVGSVHAVTEQGEVVIASNTGSQLPAYAYASPHIVLVVGAQKLVATLDQAMKRIYDYVLPLESERAQKAYGVAGSNVSKLLIINKETQPGRITMVIVKESLGY